MAARSGQAARWAREGALPLALGASAVLLVCGAYAWAPVGFAAGGGLHLGAWILLLGAGLAAGARQLRFRLRERSGRAAPRRWSAEAGLVLGLGALALTQASGGLASPLFPLLYLLGAGYVLALPMTLAAPLLAALLGLDAALFAAAGALPARWPQLAAHAAFAVLFASLYHALLGARLLQSRRAEKDAVRQRIAEAEERARELRLVATADPLDSAASSPDAPSSPGAEQDARERQLLSAVSELDDALRGALAVAEAALRPHTVAVFLTAPDGSTLRLRECLSRSERLFRGPLASREGALGALLAAGHPIRLEGDGPALSYYEGAPPVPHFLGVPLRERDPVREGDLFGVLVADRDTPFSSDDERVLSLLAAEIVRAIESERLLLAVRREKEEKARFFRALEDLNRATALAPAAECAVAHARRMCPALDLCAVTLFDAPEAGRRGRHRVLSAAGEGAAMLRELSFAENAGLVSNVVRLGAQLPGRALGAMERVVIFDGGTVVRGLAALKIFPLRAGEETVGTLVCASRRKDALPESAQRELSLLALQAAEALVRTRLYEQTQRLATTDGLTGLLNRRMMQTQLSARLREAQRYKRNLSFLLLDIDHFKKVNDTYGHPAGDAVLRGVAALAAEQARETDLVARYGGEEMALVLPETDEAGARVIAERVRAAIAAAEHPSEAGRIRCTVSIGVATWPGAGADEAALIEAADKALYRAKQGGRNRVETAHGRAAARGDSRGSRAPPNGDRIIPL